MADEKPTTPEKEPTPPERHTHEWSGFVTGDGNAAVHTRICNTCGKAEVN